MRRNNKSFLMPLPPEIDFGFRHEDSKIWSLKLASEDMNIEELASNLNIAYLDKEGTDDWNLTLKELIAFLEKNPSHYQRIERADLKYPINIYFFKGSWKILDGVHRLCKAIMEGKKTIAVCKITPAMIPLILKE